MDCWWSVFVEHHGDDPVVVTDDAIGDFVTALVPHSGIATGGGGHLAWGARVSVEAATAADAVTKAAKILARHGEAAGLPSWPLVHAEATREDMLDEAGQHGRGVSVSASSRSSRWAR